MQVVYYYVIASFPFCLRITYTRTPVFFLCETSCIIYSRARRRSVKPPKNDCQMDDSECHSSFGEFPSKTCRRWTRNAGLWPVQQRLSKTSQVTMSSEDPSRISDLVRCDVASNNRTSDFTVQVFWVAQMPRSTVLCLRCCPCMSNR